MKTIIPLTIIILFLHVESKSQTTKMIKSYKSFEELLIQKKNDKEQTKILVEFRMTFDEKDRFSIEEYRDYYQITVSHSSQEGYSGGAECYRLDKKTGQSKIIWHEHPMKE